MNKRTKIEHFNTCLEILSEQYPLNHLVYDTNFTTVTATGHNLTLPIDFWSYVTLEFMKLYVMRWIKAEVNE